MRTNSEKLQQVEKYVKDKTKLFGGGKFTGGKSERSRAILEVLKAIDWILNQED